MRPLTTTPTALVRTHATISTPPGTTPEVVLARTDAQQWITWNPDVHAHLLVGARPGFGRTSTLRTAVLSWTAAGGSAYLIDPYHRDLEGLRNWPNVQAVAGQGDRGAALALVHDLHATMQRRYQNLKDGTVQRRDLSPILLVIDEFADFHGWCRKEQPTTTSGLHDGATTGVGQEQRPHEVINTLLEKGAAARIHLAVGVTRCGGEHLSARRRNAFDQWVWAGPMGELDSLMLGFSRQGADLSSREAGRSVCGTADDHPVAAQLVWTPDPSSTHLSAGEQQQPRIPRRGVTCGQALPATAAEATSAEGAGR